MKAYRIRETWFDTTPWGVSQPKFVAGQVLPQDNEDAQRQYALGNADEVDAPDDADKAAQEAAKARAAADAALEKAANAEAAADAARAIAEMQGLDDDSEEQPSPKKRSRAAQA